MCFGIEWKGKFMIRETKLKQVEHKTCVDNSSSLHSFYFEGFCADIQIYFDLWKLRARPKNAQRGKRGAQNA